jgi:HEAT repeat protein
MYVELLFASFLFLTVRAQEGGPAEVRRWIEELRSEKVEVRGEAFRRLKELGGPARPELQKALRDPDPEVAGSARSLLSLIALREKLTPNLLKVLPGIEENLSEADLHTWTLQFLRATEAQNGLPRHPGLGTKDLSCLAPSAVRGLKTEDEQKRVFDAIDTWSLRSAAPEIADLLGDSRQPVRFHAVMLLGELGARASVPKILPLLRDENEGVRANAADALGLIGDKSAIPALRTALKSADTRLREHSAKALGILRAVEAIPDLRALAKSGDPDGRRNAIEALQAMNASEAIPDLVALLGDPDKGIRASVLVALGALRAEGAIPAMARLLRDPDRNVRRVAAMVLAEMDAKDRSKEIARFLAEPGEESAWLRAGAARDLAVLGAREEIPEIARLLTDKEPHVRYSAAESLGLLGAKEYLDPIALLLEDKDSTAVDGALRGLAELGAKEKIPDVVKCLTHADPGVRRAAIFALYRLEAGDAGSEIARLLNDPYVEVRLAASDVLCYRGSREGIPTVLKEAADLSWPIRQPDGRSMFIGKSPRALNAIRQRDAWLKLSRILVPPDVQGTRKEVVERLASDHGFKVEWSEDISPDDHPWMTAIRQLRRSIFKQTLLDEIGGLVQGRAIGNKYPRYEAIIEPDRIRIVPYHEALRFWKAWGSEAMQHK